MILSEQNGILTVGLLLPDNGSEKLHQWCYIFGWWIGTYIDGKRFQNSDTGVIR
jgi:hypothetical protein